MAIFKKRRKSVDKTYSIVNTKTDLGLDVEIQLAYWNNPSRKVISVLIDVISSDNESLTDMEDEQQKEFVNRFFDVIPDFILESDLDGLEFDTQEKAVESFEHPELPIGFMYKVVVHLVLRVLTEADYLKNVLTALSNNGNSGSVESTKVQA
jgi:hypothetical protein